MSQYLSEAFKKLSVLNEDTFSITDSGLDDFIKFSEEDEIDDTIDVIDPEAETIDDLEDSYVGKVILDCCVCHSKLYKDVEDVVIDGDIANANEECPFCYTTDGFKVIGQVASFDETEEEEETEEKDDKKVEEPKDDEELEEGLFDKFKKKPQEDEKKNSGRRVPQMVSPTSIRKGDVIYNPHTKIPAKVLNVDTSTKGTIKFGVDAPSGKNVVVVKSNGSIKKFVNESKSIKEGIHRIYVDGELKDEIESSNPVHEVDSIAYKYKKLNGVKEVRVEYADGTTNTMQVESKSIKEAINNLSLDTADTHMEMTSDENGKVTISTEPITSAEVGDETIQPLEPEVQNEIDSNVEDGGEIEIDMDEFDEESFDELGEGYLKKVYENVNSFKTSNVSFLKDKLILEGVIKFNSGNSKKTNFVFGIREATKSGKIRFIGENKEIARGRKSFTITGRVENKKFLSESLNYNYGVRNSTGKAQRLYGTIKNNKRG